MNRCPYCNSSNFGILETEKGTDFILHHYYPDSNNIDIKSGVMLKVKACEDCKGIQLVAPNLK